MERCLACEAVFWRMLPNGPNLVGRGSRKARRSTEGKPHNRREINKQGLKTRRAVAHDRPRLGAFAGLRIRCDNDHQALRCTIVVDREPRPTRFGPFGSVHDGLASEAALHGADRLSTVLAPRPLGAGGVPRRPPTVLLAPRARIGQKWGAVGK